MKLFGLITFVFLFIEADVLFSQSIGDFVSVFPEVQSEQFVFPSTHNFQNLVEVGDVLTEGGIMPIRPDFAGYVSIANSSSNGFLSINSEADPGGNTIFDINFNVASNLWESTMSQALDFSAVFGTRTNCSGTVTPWNTVISCEELPAGDSNGDGYNDHGWNVEIDPATKTVINKHWAMGNMSHENVTIHSNERTVYQGSDSNPGYLYKYISETAQELSSGLLYVYSGPKNGTGSWVLLENTTKGQRNSTLTQSANAGGTVFNGVEDVEIGPDGRVYFAVKGEGIVYALQDSDPITGTTASMETFVGGATTSYDIVHDSGTTSVLWTLGNDNLAFDGDGNLWVLQDGGQNYIWVVENGHKQINPKVKLFGIAPIDSEPTGITFTPDNKYLFMSIQHPSALNNANQRDAKGNIISFSKGTVLVLARNENLGNTLSLEDFGNKSNTFQVYPNPLQSSDRLFIKGGKVFNIKLYSIEGKLLFERYYNGLNKIKLDLVDFKTGVYLIQLNNTQVDKLIIKSGS